LHRISWVVEWLDHDLRLKFWRPVRETQSMHVMQGIIFADVGHMDLGEWFGSGYMFLGAQSCKRRPAKLNSINSD